MILTIAQYKGGVGKTTTAFHFAAYFQMQAPTLLLDSDPNRNAIEWAQRGGENIPFKVAPMTHGSKLAGQYTHIINDTKAREDTSDIVEIAEGCDLLVLPTEPGPMEYQTLLEMIEKLRESKVDPSHYRVLITKVPPLPARDGQMLYDALAGDDIPVFNNFIRYFKVFKKAAASGVPVYAVKDPKSSEAWNDYANACQEVQP